MLQCALCKRIKPVSDFYERKERKRGYSSRCKECKNLYGKTESAKKRRNEQRRLRRMEFKKMHPELCRKLDRQRNLKRSHGITEEEYTEIYNKQGGKCAICLSVLPQVLAQRLFVDHSHVTGRIRGLLCAKCNFGLGNFKESERRLYAAIRYLRQFSDDWNWCNAMLGSNIKVKVSGHATVTYPPEAIERRLKELATMEQTEEVKKEIERLKEYQK